MWTRPKTFSRGDKYLSLFNRFLVYSCMIKLGKSNHKVKEENERIRPKLTNLFKHTFSSLYECSGRSHVP